MAGVVLAQALHGEFSADGFKGLEHGGPVLGIAEPELVILLVHELVLEYQVVGVDGFPTLGAFWHREIGGLGEGCVFHG